MFVPTGSPAPDYYGAMRLGDNRYANSVVALNASTGALVWAFQTVHHDLWDYDNASPPALVSVTHAGARVPAVVQATKTGMLFVLNRENGRPLHPVEERAVPASNIPQEQAARTQPFTVATPPLSPHRLTPDQIWATSDADRAACRAAIEGLRNEGIFHAARCERHSGHAVEHRRRALGRYCRRPWYARLPSCPSTVSRQWCSSFPARVSTWRVRGAKNSGWATITNTIRCRALLMSCGGGCCLRRPACHARRRRSARWSRSICRPASASGKRRSGRFSSPLSAELAAKVPSEWGSPNLGGPIVTAGGVVFIGAALDRSLHAFDIETGRHLWNGSLPQSGKATPMSYQLASGEQFVVIVAGGGGAWGAGDYSSPFGSPRFGTRNLAFVPRQIPDSASTPNS